MMKHRTIHDLEELAKPFIDIGLYDSDVTFFRDLLESTVEHKLNHYEQIIKKLERKYDVSFGDFSKKLERGATITEEDDWMEWEAAINMLGAWRKTGRLHKYLI
uniref:Uncharacterized protein n=1 Tax=Candidatus Methanogaster sp. ANME-2c ERB4 TaxID=2759911 RepID=A0A7G9YNS6_9EURY|nr:hypothetical protein FBMMOPGC_00007 [Methanosarcinales archaeon ANME-2c ERB4]QNO50107.1 hypothetical protein GDOAKEED_00011 [Methanosarcinales archaeon ANME-2c ERB4]